MKTFRKFIYLYIIAISYILMGCALGAPKFKIALPPSAEDNKYSLKPTGKVAVGLTFSGGGSLAAVYAAAITEELYNNPIFTVAPPAGDQAQGNKLSSRTSFGKVVDDVSSISGGSITASYLGVYGDFSWDKAIPQISADFVSPLFLRVLLCGQSIARSLDNELHEQLFAQKNYSLAALHQPNRPNVFIHATNIDQQKLFTFAPETFRKHQIGYADFPLTSAIVASASVPTLIGPVYIAGKNPRKDIELQDGALVDNLGIIPLIRRYQHMLNNNKIRKAVIISVDTRKETLERRRTKFYETLLVTRQKQVLELAKNIPNLEIINLDFYTLIDISPEQTTKLQTQFPDLVTSIEKYFSTRKGKNSPLKEKIILLGKAANDVNISLDIPTKDIQTIQLTGKVVTALYADKIRDAYEKVRKN